MNLDTAPFFPKPAPSAMTPYLMYPFHECHLQVGPAPWNGASSLLATFYVESSESHGKVDCCAAGWASQP